MARLNMRADSGLSTRTKGASRDTVGSTNRRTKATISRAAWPRQNSSTGKKRCGRMCWSPATTRGSRSATRSCGRISGADSFHSLIIYKSHQNIFLVVAIWWQLMPSSSDPSSSKCIKLLFFRSIWLFSPSDRPSSNLFASHSLKAGLDTSYFTFRFVSIPYPLLCISSPSVMDKFLILAALASPLYLAITATRM